MTTSGVVAGKILSQVPPERAFRFYAGVDNPLGVSATSLRELCDVVARVDVRSLEFHTQRGDFEKWTYMLGDADLVKRLIKLRNENPRGERLRAKLLRILRTRLSQLQRSETRR